MNSKFYITTPIYYPNANLHMGHAYTTTLCDILARFHRNQGDEVFFLSGTDDHAIKVAKAASKAGKDPRDFVVEKGENFKEFYKKLNIANDDFIQTSDEKRHWAGAQEVWKLIDKKGDLYKKTYTGLYCTGCEAFVKESDLVDGKEPLHNEIPQNVEEENYFFKLSHYGDILKEKITSGELQIIPETRKNEILSLIDQGLEDVSFSRPIKNIKWGIPVPGDETQTMYVWCDALTNYITALGFGQSDTTKYDKFWPADVHVVGKDILRFHAAIWPAMLISAELPLPKKILAHGFITSEGRKMSKTLGNVVDPNEIMEKYGVDALRYWLGSVNPYDDGDFTIEKFEALYNADLANNLGNLFSRVVHMIDTNLESELIYNSKFMSKRVENEMQKTTKVYLEKMNNFKVNEALSDVWTLLSFANAYIDEKKPWKTVKTDTNEFMRTITSLARLLGDVSWMLWPFMPETVGKMGKMFGVEGKIKELEEFKFIISNIEPLFPRLDS